MMGCQLSRAFAQYRGAATCDNLRSTPTASRSMCLARRQAGQLLCDAAHVTGREIEVVGSRDFRVHGVQSWLRQTIGLREKLDGAVVLASG